MQNTCVEKFLLTKPICFSYGMMRCTCLVCCYNNFDVYLFSISRCRVHAVKNQPVQESANANQMAKLAFQNVPARQDIV